MAKCLATTILSTNTAQQEIAHKHTRENKQITVSKRHSLIAKRQKLTNASRHYSVVTPIYEKE